MSSERVCKRWQQNCAPACAQHHFGCDLVDEASMNSSSDTPPESQSNNCCTSGRRITASSAPRKRRRHSPKELTVSGHQEPRVASSGLFSMSKGRNASSGHDHCTDGAKPIVVHTSIQVSGQNDKRPYQASDRERCASVRTRSASASSGSASSRITPPRRFNARIQLRKISRSNSLPPFAQCFCISS